MNWDREMERALEADGEKLRQLTGEDHGPFALADELTFMEAQTSTFAAPNPDDYEVERDGTTLHVMRFANGTACVIERGANGEGPDKGQFAPYHNLPLTDAETMMVAHGWALKTTQQMSVTGRSDGYNNVTVSGVCSPDVTVEDVKKRFYHFYFGGRGAWVKDGRFGCTIHTD